MSSTLYLLIDSGLGIGSGGPKDRDAQGPKLAEGFMMPKAKVSKRKLETLEYIQAMLGQLRTMTEAERCDMLAYMIEMAYIQASDTIRDMTQAKVPKSTAA